MNNQVWRKFIKNRIEKKEKQISFFQIRIESFLEDDNVLMVNRYQKVIEELRKNNYDLNLELDEFSKTINQQNSFLLEDNNIIIKQPTINKWDEKIYRACQENGKIEITNLKCMSNGCSIS